MYAPQERNCIQHHCYVGQVFLVTEEVFLVVEEVFLVTEEVFLVVEEKVCFFVYRLALDAKPDRGML